MEAITGGFVFARFSVPISGYGETIVFHNDLAHGNVSNLDKLWKSFISPAAFQMARGIPNLLADIPRCSQMLQDILKYSQILSNTPKDSQIPGHLL